MFAVEKIRWLSSLAVLSVLMSCSASKKEASVFMQTAPSWVGNACSASLPCPSGGVCDSLADGTCRVACATPGLSAAPCQTTEVCNPLTGTCEPSCQTANDCASLVNTNIPSLSNIGCSSTSPGYCKISCGQNSDCNPTGSTTLVCSNNTCVPACGVGNTCPTGTNQICSAGACSLPSCTPSCPGGYTCSFPPYCEPTPCTQNGCAAGQVCNSQSQQCGPCIHSTDCAARSNGLTLCDNGVCVAPCNSTSCTGGQVCGSSQLCVDCNAPGAGQCPVGQSCDQAGLCTCTSGQLCPGNEPCLSGKCTACNATTNPCPSSLPACQSNGSCTLKCPAYSCPIGQACGAGGICGLCSASVNCPTNQVCNNAGVCEPTCTSTAQCGSGEVCANGGCQASTSSNHCGNGVIETNFQETCDEGTLNTQCKTSIDCADKLSCIAGVCKHDPERPRGNGLNGHCSTACTSVCAVTVYSGLTNPFQGQTPASPAANMRSASLLSAVLNPPATNSSSASILANTATNSFPCTTNGPSCPFGFIVSGAGGPACQCQAPQVPPACSSTAPCPAGYQCSSPTGGTCSRITCPASSGPGAFYPYGSSTDDISICPCGYGVWVANGSYADGNISVPGTISIFGGFSGSEISIYDRTDPALTPPAPLGQESFSGTILKPSAGGFVLGDGTNTMSIILDGFQIQDGGDTAVQIKGGTTTATLQNLRIAGNHTASPTPGTGGGINNEGILFLKDSMIALNHAPVAGGGIFHNGPSATIERTTFWGNWAGADSRNAPSVNSTGPYGGAIGASGGSSQLNIYASKFNGNYVYGSGGAIGSSMQLTMVSSLFAGNWASSQGGALALISVPQSTAKLYNLTFIDNAAYGDGGGAGGGAIFDGQGTSTTLQSSLFRDNHGLYPSSTVPEWNGNRTTGFGVSDTNSIYTTASNNYSYVDICPVIAYNYSTGVCDGTQTCGSLPSILNFSNGISFNTNATAQNTCNRVAEFTDCTAPLYRDCAPNFAEMISDPGASAPTAFYAKDLAGISFPSSGGVVRGAYQGCGQASDCPTNRPICSGGACIQCNSSTPCANNNVCQSGQCLCGGAPGCSGATPFCVASTSECPLGPSQACVQCASNADCQSPTPICNCGTCLQCAVNTDCSQGSVCIYGEGTCCQQANVCGNQDDCCAPGQTCSYSPQAGYVCI